MNGLRSMKLRVCLLDDPRSPVLTLSILIEVSSLGSRLTILAYELAISKDMDKEMQESRVHTYRESSE